MTKTMRRAGFLLAALLFGVTFLASAANAQEGTFNNDDDYNALCIPLQLSSSSVSAGDPVTVSGTAATGGATIAIVFNGTTVLDTTTSDPTNHFFSKVVTIPADAPAGTNTLQAVQLGDNTDPRVGCPASISNITVLGLTITPPVAQPPLARTGTNSTMPLARAGFGLLAAGGLALLISRKRRNALAA